MTDSADRVKQRQDTDYEVPVLEEPEGGPVPPWNPILDDE